MRKSAHPAASRRTWLLALLAALAMTLAPAQAVLAASAPGAATLAAAGSPTAAAASTAATAATAAAASTAATAATAATTATAATAQTAPSATGETAAAAPSAPAWTSTQPLQGLALAAGQLHTLLVHADGRLFSFGDNTYGQLGLGSESPQAEPVAVALGERAQAASAGAYHSLVLLAGGKVLAFGRNAFGQLGTGNVANQPSPQTLGGLPEAAAVAAGAWHSLVLGRDGSVWAFGDNTHGQCGPAAAEDVLSEAGQLIARRVTRPQRILASGARAIAAGAAHSLILMENGQVLAFGANTYGQLGDGSSTSRSEMLPVPGISQAALIAAGSDHSLVVMRDPAPGASPTQGQGQGAAAAGSRQVLMAFGDNSLGQLGSGTDYAPESQERTPVRISWTDAAGAGYEIRKLAAGFGNSLLIVEKSTAPGSTGEGLSATATTAPAAKADPRTARVLIWGSNAYGQLGTGDDASRDRPTLLKAIDQGYSGDTWLPFEAAAIGGGHILLASSRGLLGASGRNGDGQLGFFGSMNEPSFIGVPLPPLSAAPAIDLARTREAAFGASVRDRRDPAKVLPLQVPWDTSYAFGENSAPVPPDPRLPYLIVTGALLALAALLGIGLIIHQYREKRKKAMASARLLNGGTGTGPAEPAAKPASADSPDSVPTLADSGPSPADSGPSPADSGPSPADSGPSPADSGPSPADSSENT